MIDILKAGRDKLAEVIAHVEGVFLPAHKDVLAEFERIIAEIEAEAARVPTLADVRALLDRIK